MPKNRHKKSGVSVYRNCRRRPVGASSSPRRYLKKKITNKKREKTGTHLCLCVSVCVWEMTGRKKKREKNITGDLYSCVYMARLVKEERMRVQGV